MKNDGATRTTVKIYSPISARAVFAFSILTWVAGYIVLPLFHWLPESVTELIKEGGGVIFLFLLAVTAYHQFVSRKERGCIVVDTDGVYITCNGTRYVFSREEVKDTITVYRPLNPGRISRLFNINTVIKVTFSADSKRSLTFTNSQTDLSKVVAAIKETMTVPLQEIKLNGVQLLMHIFFK